MNRRVLHLVRGALPDPAAVQPGDLVLVVYMPGDTRDADAPAGAEPRWRIAPPTAESNAAPTHDPRSAHADAILDSRAVCRLAFEYDHVIVW